MATGAAAGAVQVRGISGDASAEVIKQISGASVTDIVFGKIVPSSAAGTIVISSNGDITSNGGVRYIPNSGANNGTVRFTGDPSQAILIDTPSRVTLRNGTNTMNLAFTYASIPSAVPSSGLFSVDFGGTLSVGANQAPGVYTATYDFTVTYV